MRGGDAERNEIDFFFESHFGAMHEFMIGREKNDETSFNYQQVGTEE